MVADFGMPASETVTKCNRLEMIPDDGIAWFASLTQN
jgi:hypothetical protein